MGELLNMGEHFEFWVNFSIIGKLLNYGELLNYGLSFELQISFDLWVNLSSARPLGGKFKAKK